MRKTLALAVKEFRQISRDPLTLIMLLGVPAFMLLIYGYALSFDVKHVTLVAQDRSQTQESRTLISAFSHTEYFDWVGTFPATEDIDDLFQRRLARAALIIPEDYANELRSGRVSPVQFIIDGSDSNLGTTVLGYAQTVINQLNAQGLTLASPLRVEPRVWYNPELKSTQFLVPGLIGFIMMLTAVLSTALSIVREKERGTMEQLRAAAIRPDQMILGKTLPYLLISLAATVIILGTAWVLFDVKIRGSIPQLFVATLIYLLGALGLGLFVSSMAKTQAMAFQFGSLISMLPTIFLSGFIFPIRNMPAGLQAITYVFPARYYLVVLRGIILKGASLSVFGTELLFLLLYAVAISAIAYRRLARRDL